MSSCEIRSGSSGVAGRCGSALLSLPVIVCIVLFFPAAVRAEGGVSYAAYAESISLDEQGGNLMFPSFVTVDPTLNEIYVVDGKQRITVYTSDLFPLYTLGKKNGIETPMGLAVDSEGTLYVAQGATKGDPRAKISVFNACFKWQRDIRMEGFEGSDAFIPYRLAVDGKGIIYVAGINSPGVAVIDKDGKLLELLSPENGGEKVRFVNVTIDKEGKLYLLSEEESSIYVYDGERKFLFKFGEKGGSSGKLSRPKAVAVDDRSGSIFVVDYMRHAVNIYDKKGTFINEFGGMGWSEGWFQYPTHLFVDQKGRLMVTDTFNNRVQLFKIGG